MSVIEILRTKRMWIALASSLIILLLLFAISALLVEKGVIHSSSQLSCICGSYLAAAIVGGLIAGKQKKGRMTLSVINAILLIVMVFIMTLILYGGVRVTTNTWKILLSMILGGMCAGILGASRGARRSKGRKRVSPNKKPMHRR